MKAATSYMRRTLELAIVILLVACTGNSDPVGVPGNGSIRGSVTDNTGAPVANAAVQLSGNSQAARTTSAGGDGGFSFTEVPPGTYTLKVTPPTGYTPGGASTVSISVATETEAEAATFVLQPVTITGSIRGTVVDNTNTLVPNIAVELSGNGQASRTASTGMDGAYTFTNVVPGAYTLTIKPPPAFAIGNAGTAEVTVEGGVQANAGEFVLNRLSQDAAFAAALHTRLQQATAAEQFSGAVLVVRDGVTLFEGAYGSADREQNIPNSTDTKFRVGSMNKMLTAVAVMQLVQEGKVQLNAPLNTYLTDYPNTSLATKVTLHHLLTHTGGTGDIFGPQFNENRLELRDIDDYLQLYGTRGLQFEPGELWQYSNYGFMLLGAVIERVTGMSYDDYIATHVLAPAGMTATGAAPESSSVPDRAAGYMRQGDVLVSNASTLPYRGTPAGGWYSTVRDMERFASAIQQNILLDPAHTALLITGKIPFPPTPEQYAYGFIDRLLTGRRFVGHTGGAAGMSGHLDFEPGSGYTIVVLSNFSPPATTIINGFIMSILPNQ